MSLISLSEIAERILRGGTLDDKLFGALIKPQEIEWNAKYTFEDTVLLPGRVGCLDPNVSKRRAGDEVFPKSSELKNQSMRGKLLHFFANHELLAMESMALTLLRFPDAPVEFKQGVFKTLQDEQRHFKSYQSRMQDYGVAIGDFPLNLYFWNTLKDIRSPLDFVVRMSMTFEQANLDFALEFSRQMEERGDQTTASLLRTVHDDEVRHVQHGLKWFNEWRTQSVQCQETEWQAYTRLLPFPMTPRRAKGKWFSARSRIEAGFSKEYIDELKIAGGSRGRAPDLFYFNPQCEIEPQALPQVLKQKILDLEPLMMWLGKESDVVEMSTKPPREWLACVHDIKGELPEIIFSLEETSKYAFFENFKPWGWSVSANERFKQLKEKIRNQAPAEFALSQNASWLSKAWWANKILSHSGLAIAVPPKAVVKSKEELHVWMLAQLKVGESAILKLPQSMSGRGHQIVLFGEDHAVEFKNGQSFVAEKYFHKRADFSTQFEIMPSGELKIYEPRFFQNNPHFQYQGAYLGNAPRPEIPPPFWECLKQNGELRLKVIHAIAEILRAERYIGPVGLDGLIYEEEGKLKLHPLLEVNARMTMGRVALEIENCLRKKSLDLNRFWKFYSAGELNKLGFKNFVELEEHLIKLYPGMISTTPAATSKATWTVIL